MAFVLFKCQSLSPVSRFSRLGIGILNLNNPKSPTLVVPYLQPPRLAAPHSPSRSTLKLSWLGTVISTWSLRKENHLALEVPALHCQHLYHSGAQSNHSIFDLYIYIYHIQIYIYIYIYIHIYIYIIYIFKLGQVSEKSLLDWFAVWSSSWKLGLKQFPVELHSY